MELLGQLGTLALRNSQTGFHSSRTIFCSTKNTLRVPISPRPPPPGLGIVHLPTCSHGCREACAKGPVDAPCFGALAPPLPALWCVWPLTPRRCKAPLLSVCEVPCRLERWLTAQGCFPGCEGCEWSKNLSHEMSVELGGSQPCAEQGLMGEHSWGPARFQGQLEG